MSAEHNPIERMTMVLATLAPATPCTMPTAIVPTAAAAVPSVRKRIGRGRIAFL
jgi:hypothetical protein